MKSYNIAVLALQILLTSFLANSQCNTNTSICSAGTAGPFAFNTPGTPVSTCLDFFGPSVSYITLHITTGGPLEMLIDANATNGFIDVAVFNVPTGIDPCLAIQNNANEIGCNYASNPSGCNQFGTAFPCPSSVPAPLVNAGDELMIVVENWSGASFTFNLQLGTGAQTGQPNPTISGASSMLTSDPPLGLLAANGGGTWSSSCGACIDPITGQFDPSVAGPGIHSICYDIGVTPCDTQDCILLDVSSLLGAEVSSVGLSCEDHAVAFEWQTSQETNCSHFLIEKSRDAMNFEVTGSVEGNGNSTGTISYTYEEPYDFDNNYYRLTEVDLNGTSTVIGVYYTNCDSPDISVFPNPGADKINLSYNNFNLHETRISIFDYSGRLVFETDANISGEAEIDISHLSSQVYTIRIGDSSEHKFVRFAKI
ncbi:MAG: T9SS type A sorting domain-containing protein [Crocinitomicaceae bacterium]|nr:T9SS type A sorting domain-containing protein [Crocinitomicaceae bacterium]